MIQLTKQNETKNKIIENSIGLLYRGSMYEKIYKYQLSFLSYDSN